jgi:hypothetical protein
MIPFHEQKEKKKKKKKGEKKKLDPCANLQSMIWGQAHPGGYCGLGTVGFFLGLWVRLD